MRTQSTKTVTFMVPVHRTSNKGMSEVQNMSKEEPEVRLCDRNTEPYTVFNRVLGPRVLFSNKQEACVEFSVFVRCNVSDNFSD